MQEYLIILLPALLIGLLHTLMPCEDKAIFCFWSYGISKPKNSILLLIAYGLGLMTANLIIATITILISLIPLIIFPSLFSDPHTINFFGALSSAIVAIFFLFFITQKDYLPHSKHIEKIMSLDWEKKRTPYLFGILTGMPPCAFELYIYSQCLIYSLSYGFVQGFLTVLYFSIGTFIGLFPLSLLQHKLESQPFEKEKRAKGKKNIYYVIMLLIIIFVNIIIMVLSFLRIHVFPVETI